MMNSLDESFQERAAIIEYEGQLSREDAESMAMASFYHKNETIADKNETIADKNETNYPSCHSTNKITLTKIEMEVLTLVRNAGRLHFSSQDAEKKKALTRLIKKGLVRMTVTGEAIEKAS